MSAMRLPIATYRLQFHKDFGFAQAQAIIDYLSDLGISDVYASPLFKARTGSGHGYDVVDHNRLEPSLGSEDDFESFAATLRSHGLGLILDIVPNHMGIAETSNAWWMDVLENGPSSNYAGYFDIDWRPVNPHLENKVLLPILEDQYGNVLEDGKLRLTYEDGAFFLCYYDTKLPIAPRTYGNILERWLDSLTEKLGKDDPSVLEFQSILTALGHLPLRTELDPEKRAERHREKEIIKRRIASLYTESIEVREAIDQTVREFNGRVGDPRSFDLLDRLMDAQAYRLAFWRVSGEEINYRRFFDINELAAIRTETTEVFQATHQLVLRLLVEGKATGLRVDHPDGLWDPASYFEQLQQSYASQWAQSLRDAGLDAAAGPNKKETSRGRLYIVAEKVLADGESLPEDWAVSGTTGYDFLSQVNRVFVRRASRRAFDKIYGDFTSSKTSFRNLVNSTKKMIMLVSLASEINALSHQLDDISERDRHYRDFTLNNLTFVIREVIACLPVYRTYTNASKDAVSERDRKYIEAAVEEAKKRNPRTARAVFDFIADTLLLRNLHRFSETDRPKVVDFVMEFQQLTGPVMAKGVEDTAFYIYNRLTSLNEVGGDPAIFGISLDDFHRQNAARRRHWPYSMLATTTHDTKRSEDVRARINVLSENPAEWKSALTRWQRSNLSKKTQVDGNLAPDCNDEYLLYQTLLGTWPAEPPTGETLNHFRERIAAYMQKAIKEAKVHTSWVNPNEAYEQAVDNFVRRVLPSEPDNGFLNDLKEFQARIAYPGMVNSLAQTLLKISSPGVADFYQGTELWDFSLVDPDNRHPVDFAARTSLLNEIKRREQIDRKHLANELSENWRDGRIKLYVTHVALTFRRAHTQLFLNGDYLPVYATGAMREHVCAFIRRHGDLWALVAVPRFITAPARPGERLGGAMWHESALLLPNNVPGQWLNNLTGESYTTTPGPKKSYLAVARLFESVPVALCSPVGQRLQDE